MEEHPRLEAEWQRLRHLFEKETVWIFYLVHKTLNYRKCADMHLQWALRLSLRRPAMVERRKESAVDLCACTLQHRNRCRTTGVNATQLWKKMQKAKIPLHLSWTFFNRVIIMSFFCKSTFDALSEHKQKVDYDCDKGSRPFPSPHRPLLV